MIKVTKGNSLVLTNMSFGNCRVESVINIDATFIVLCTKNEIEVYNKKMSKINYKISKHIESSEYTILA